MSVGGVGRFRIHLEEIDQVLLGRFAVVFFQGNASQVVMRLGIAIVELEGNTSEITPPAQVGADLAALAESDPILYRDVVRVIGSMLGQR